MNKAIQKAIEGGWNGTIVKPDTRVYDLPEYKMAYDHTRFCIALLDPLFWQALGKAEGWGNSFGFIQTSDTGEIDKWLESDSAGTVYQWRYHWHRFIDHLSEGKDPDSFFNELIK